MPSRPGAKSCSADPFPTNERHFPVPKSTSTSAAHPLLEVADRLSRRLSRLRFGEPVTHVHNPLVYAREAHADYLLRYGTETREVLLLGMNPGPWGMAQTGVPFGEVGLVRDWLKIRGTIGKPKREHPKRPVDGLGCGRSEVSGARLWGWARDRFGSPKKFFRRFFVINYCPLSFMEEADRNRTPDKLPAGEREPLFRACDDALRETAQYFQPKWVIGVGQFAEKRATDALDGTGVQIGRMLHPSPASPLANRNWAGNAEADLRGMGIEF